MQFISLQLVEDVALLFALGIVTPGWSKNLE